MSDTIFALATPPGRGAIAVLRLSGPATETTLTALGAGGLTPRLASVRSLRQEGRLIDEALVLRFVAPRSYTGEDSAELHLHGGRAVVEAASTALIALGLRPAEPGEFTRRAFQNGRMDLAQAEAVADLIDAETDAQKSQALGQLDGALSAAYAGFRRDLLKALSLVEAEIDFPDEEVPDNLARTAGPVLDALAADEPAPLRYTCVKCLERGCIGDCAGSFSYQYEAQFCGRCQKVCRHQRSVDDRGVHSDWICDVGCAR